MSTGKAMGEWLEDTLEGVLTMADISGTFYFVPIADLEKPPFETCAHNNGPLSAADWENRVISGVVDVGTAGTHAYRRVRLLPKTAASGMEGFHAVPCDPATGAYAFYGLFPGTWEVIVYGDGIHRSIVHGPVTIT